MLFYQEKRIEILRGTCIAGMNAGMAGNTRNALDGI